MKQRVLIVDDNDFTAIYLEGLIGDRYEIAHFSDGESGVAAAISNPPRVVLMDVEMPGMDGYSACRLLKQAPATQEVPVIFLSARVEAADRLAGYEAGGDDYITKPFEPEELLYKIDVLLRRQQRKQDLAMQAKVATDTAMTAMSSAGDAGLIMRFLAGLVGYLDCRSVAHGILGTMDAFGLDTSLQLRDGSEVLSLSRDGMCSPLEESVLSNMASCGRIVDLGSRSAFNFPRVTIIVKSMPRDNPELYGRIKDNLAKVVEAVDLHLQTLARVQAAITRGDKLLALLQRNMGTLRDIEGRYRVQRAASSQILNTLVNDIEASFVSLGLTEDQECRLQNRIRDAIDEAQSLYAQEVEADSIMLSLNQDFDLVLQQEAAAAAVVAVPEPASNGEASADSSIELF